MKLLLLNQGGHIFIGDKVSLSGQVKWEWVRFVDFEHGNFISQILGESSLNKKVRLKHLGHKHRLAEVTLTQYLEKGYGNKGKTQVLKDWTMSFYLLPNRPVLVQTVGDVTVIASPTVFM